MILCLSFFFFKQKTAYEMRISDWSSDVCSSDLMDQLPLPSGLLDVGGIRVADGVVVLETLNGRGVLALNALREVFLATRERLRLRHHAAKQRDRKSVG